MSAKPTIDSVSRELLELAFRAVNGGDTQLSGMEHGRAFRELRAILAAPVVERKEPVAPKFTSEFLPDGEDGWGYKLTGEFYRASEVDKFFETARPQLAELQALSVTNIMLDVVPGDGDGHEVYAKSAADVEAALSRLDEKNEELQSTIEQQAVLLREVLGLIDDGVGRSDLEWALIQKLRDATEPRT